MADDKPIKIDVKEIDDELVAKVVDQTATLTELFGFADSYDIWMMFLGSIGGLISGGSMSVICVIFGQMLDSLNEGGDLVNAVNTVCIYFLIICGCTFIGGIIQVTCWTIAGERQAQRFKEKYVRSILSQEVGWFDTCGASELSTQVADLTGKVQDGITRRAGDIVQYTTQFMFSFAAAFYLQWKLTVVLLAAFPTIAISGTLLIRAVTAAQNGTADQYSQAGGLASQTLKSVRTISALNAQPNVIALYREYILKAMGISLFKELKVGFFNGLTFCLSFFNYALGFWYGATLVAQDMDDGCKENCISGGIVVSVFFSVLVGASALGQLSPPLGVFFSAKAAAASILAVINRKPLIDGLSNEGDKPDGQISGNLEINHVNFSYPSRPQLQVCNDYTLSIKQGETVALCGPSGAGMYFDKQSLICHNFIILIIIVDFF